jgi:hypothetical protein
MTLQKEPSPMKAEVFDDIAAECPVDAIGTAAYFANFQHFKTLKVFVALLGFALVACIAAVAMIATRPPTIAIYRIAGDGKVEAMSLSGSSTTYTPQDAEIRRDLNAWVLWRYRLTKATSPEDFSKNYYFLSSDLTRRLRPTDTESVAAVVAGSEPEQMVSIDRITIKPEPLRNTPRGVVGVGAAQIEIHLHPGLDEYSAAAVREHWLLDLRYEVNPTGAAKRAQRDPASQVYNPLGVTLTSFFATRLAEPVKEAMK